MAARTQLRQPGQPHSPVAQKTMHQHHAALPCGGGWQPVGLLTVGKGLQPAKHPGTGQRLQPPGAQQRPPACCRGGIAAVDAAHQHKLQAQPGQAGAGRYRPAPQGQRQRTRPRPSQPRCAGQQPAQHQYFLPTCIHARKLPRQRLGVCPQPLAAGNVGTIKRRFSLGFLLLLFTPLWLRPRYSR